MENIMVVNHKEAFEYATLRQTDSNLARAYIEKCKQMEEMEQLMSKIAARLNASRVEIDLILYPVGGMATG